ncbi:MAG: RNA methyltransferase [Planctomycetota bacterium]|nr:MAG: RNA methyltransferase [Planctomycetota bacterium]
MIQHISSRHNPRVKEALRLRDARCRRQAGRFVIDGAREVLRAIAGDVEILEAFLCEPLLGGDEARRAADELAAHAGVAQTVTVEIFDKLSYGNRADGVLAVARTPTRSLAQLSLPPAPLVAVIEGIEKPGNVGAVLRSADGAGLDAVVVADPRTDLFNPNAIRASLGTVFRANVCTATTEETVAWLKRLDVPALAARPDAERLYTAADFRQGAAIVLGSEAQGLSARWSGPGVAGIRLPMHGVADSLNVSAAAAVLFYEAQRQRSQSPRGAR